MKKRNTRTRNSPRARSYVTAPASSEDRRPEWTNAIREHNQMVFSDPDFDAFILPTRDGVLVARRR